MISSLYDYKFVTGANIDAGHPYGDLQRITINGGVMPLRTGVSASTGVENAKILRGEDPAFLMEAMQERMAVMFTETSSPKVFSRVIDHLPMKNWCNNLRYYTSIHEFIKQTPTEQYDISSDPLVYVSLSDIESDPSDFTDGHALTKSSVEKMFRDLKLMTMVNTRRTERTEGENTVYGHVDYDEEYPYTDRGTSSFAELMYAAYYGDNIGTHEKAYGGKNWKYQTSNWTFSFPVQVQSVEYWKAIELREYNSIPNSQTYIRSFFDFVKVGTAVTSDGGFNWTLDLGLSQLQTLFSRICAKHISRGELVHGMNYDPTQEGEVYELSMTIFSAGLYPTNLVTLGDHTKWW